MEDWKYRIEALRTMKALVDVKSPLLKTYPKNHYRVMLDEAKKLAANWDFCYIGENKKSLKRLGVKFEPHEGYPDKELLETYGLLFQIAIFSEKFDEALEIARKVDKEISNLAAAKLFNKSKGNDGHSG